MNTVILGLGSNQGNRLYYLNEAILQIGSNIGEIDDLSNIYEAESWGFSADQKFLNMAVRVLTELSPENVLLEIEKIEKNLGRVRSSDEYASRTLDIDILFYEDLILNLPHLQIPHPYIISRNFVLIPLEEIDPGFVHPEYKKTVTDLLSECQDKCEVTVYKM